ncbi:hypothetical protein B0T16DRAFT_393352 [Cercophora newfieldiana]|uniref:Secreted protein n=1 Tax=Cercophora newfieldiana TaxID=92897 RepID=A0AA40CJS6_9PEZI|nr:hypothetical protein B0T16DRAFT_393352 [Cercophora newfieldiana]
MRPTCHLLRLLLLLLLFSTVAKLLLAIAGDGYLTQPTGTLGVGVQAGGWLANSQKSNESVSCGPACGPGTSKSPLLAARHAFSPCCGSRSKLSPSVRCTCARPLASDTFDILPS